MKISLNSMKSFADRYGSGDKLFDLEQGLLIEKIGRQLGAVEEVVEFGKSFEGAVVADVVSCEQHPDADRLKVCLIHDAGRTPDVQRNENNLVQVVCGAPNVTVGMKVVWLPPGSTVPSTRSLEPFVLEAREIRGVVSNGMIASAKELGLGDDHSGILELDNESESGTPFANAYGLDGDLLIDIENKMFTHRPDCFGFMGVAREIAGIQQKPFKSPDWYEANPAVPGPDQERLKLNVINEIPDLVPRFTAVTMSDIQVRKSPVWLQIELAKAGIRSINNIVDLTNFFMHETGQPLHAYDYDKVKAQDEGADNATLKIRYPSEGEKLKLLNGKEITPRNEAVIIATRDRSIGLGGVMGGADTEVDDNTTNIIIECANFDMYNVRRTSMAHGLFTDAVTRFSKGQSPRQTLPVLLKMVDEVKKLGGHISGALIDEKHNLPENQPVSVAVMYINERLGLKLGGSEIRELLSNVEFEVHEEGESLKVAAPFWRTDIHIAEDVVEEVGRLYGYENMPLELPPRSATPTKVDPMLHFKAMLREQLAKFGANEVLTYSFVHGNLFERTGQDKEMAFKVSNALSPDLQYYRMSLTPSLLSLVHPNVKAGYDSFALFELNKAHNKSHQSDDEGVPREYEMLALVFAENNKTAQPAYFQARAYLDRLAAVLGVEFEYLPIEKEADVPVSKPFEPGRSALVSVSGTDITLGIVGEYKPSVRRQLKLPDASAGFEVGIQELMAARNTGSTYRQLSRFPSISQDICLQVQDSLNYATLTKNLKGKINTALGEDMYADVEPIDIYTAENLEGQKRITYRVKLASYSRTLTEEVLTGILDKIAGELKQELNASRI